MNNNNREDMLLDTLYRKRKQHMRASEKEKRDFTKNMFQEARKQHQQPRWFLRFQFALSIVAVSVLGFYMFDETRSSSAMHITHIDETAYYQVAVIERQSNGLNWLVTNKKEQLDK